MKGPRSLFGRLLWLLLGGLVGAQLLSTGIQLHDRGQVLYQAVGGESVLRIREMVRLLNPLTPVQRQQMLRQWRVPRWRVRLDIPWESGPQPTLSAPILMALLKQNLQHPFNLKLSPEKENRYRRPWHPPGMDYQRFIVQVRLSDGQVATFRQRLPSSVFQWPYQMLLTLVVLLVCMVIISIMAVRWLLRPLSLLADAADSLGKNIQRPPLEENGPVEVQRATRAFNVMQRRLLENMIQRNRFLAAVSHDLKTPLARLRLRLEKLTDLRLKQQICRDIAEMENLMQATLDLVLSGEQIGELESIDLMVLLKNVLEDRHVIDDSMVLSGPKTCRLSADPVALRRCFGNLLDNALRYGRAPYGVSVNVEKTSVLVVVEDSGTGIPASEQKKVLEPFYRLEGSRNKTTGGNGLGLSIARNIVHAHGGELTMINVVDGSGQVKGFQVTARFPLQP